MNSKSVNFNTNSDEFLAQEYAQMPTNFVTPILIKKNIEEELKKGIIAYLKKEPKCDEFEKMIVKFKIYENVLIDMNIKIDIFVVHKSNNNNSKITHDKYKTDNIIKKVLVVIFSFLVDKINSIIEKIEGCQNDNIKLEYKFKSRLKKDVYLKQLDTPIKDLLCKQNCGSENDKIIEKILKKNNPSLNYLLNLTFKEWIEFVQMKKEQEIEIFTTEELYNLFNKKFKENKDERYFCNFLFCFYYFDRWFNSINGRNRKTK